MEGSGVATLRKSSGKRKTSGVPRDSAGRHECSCRIRKAKILLVSKQQTLKSSCLLR